MTVFTSVCFQQFAISCYLSPFWKVRLIILYSTQHCVSNSCSVFIVLMNGMYSATGQKAGVMDPWSKVCTRTWGNKHCLKGHFIPSNDTTSINIITRTGTTIWPWSQWISHYIKMPKSVHFLINLQASHK